MTAGHPAQGKSVTVGADTDAERVLDTMQEHRIRRVPVIDGHRLVGMISEADLARHLPEDKVGHSVEEVCC
ncbi:CBS domain-containing protein [Streptomyces sp. NPDC093111]|uniref:CBS domain-containing protein n=1 Tax=Streptomyces sp. NPDC093111 TaxID=3154978 RepID=UPI003445A02E